VEGFHFPLRKGTEVMFVFMGGDPDRPVIAGVVPNAQKPSPVLAVNHTQNIIQTGGHNFITLEDQSGSQYINIFCPVFETNLYLGIDRPVGSFGVTSGNGPEAAEKGDFKQELGPFNFQLYTKGNGEVYTQGNLNLNATKKLQIEGQAGVYEFAEPEWKRHVKGFLKDRVNGDVSMSHLSKTAHFVGSEAPDSPPHTYVLDVTGDHKIRTTQKSMQHYMTELHEGVGTAPVGGFTHTLKVTGTEKIDISSHREVHVGDNSTIHVGGTTTQTLDGNVTTTHGATTEWNHRAGPTTLNAHGQIVTINCVEHKVNASGKSWHETNGPKSEIVWGLKHETVLGGSVGMIIGLKAEAIVGVKMEATPKAIESEALNTKLTALQSKIVSTSMRVGAASLKALAQGLETYGAMVGPAGFRMH
jgi:type VI secretion system secreted protein VgrG